MYPLQVEVNEESITRLTSTFKEAYKSIVDEIATATDFGVANRKAILAQIEATLTALGVDTQKFIETELTNQYKSGANDAVKQLGNVGADVSVSEGFNRVHVEAIRMLVDDTSKAFAESLTGVDRSAQLLLGKISRQAITQKLAEGLIGGKARAEINKIIKGTLQEQGLASLIDKGGHKWTLDRYADMLFRTKAVEARNRGLMNRMVENGKDLVQVSNHGTTHQECRVWEGKILSITGATAGYPTLGDAEAAGLFHPNCQHAINVLIPSLARLTQAYNPDVPTKVITEAEAVKQSTIPSKPKVEPIILEAGKNSVAITDLTKFESDLIKAHNLEILGKGAPRNFGVYKNYGWKMRPALEVNTTTMRKMFTDNALYEAQAKRTFYHELGHFVDARVMPGPYWESKEAGLLPTMKADGQQIVFNRLKHSYLSGGTSWTTKWGMTEANVMDVAMGKTIKLTSTEGKTVDYSLTRKNYRYYWQKEEVFADAYAQYRTQPEQFKKYAPSMFSYFEKLGGGSI
jgi:hypothetical protein